MRTALITFKNPAEQTVGEYYSALTTPLYNAGFSVDYIEVLPFTDLSAFKRALERFKDIVDNLIITFAEGASEELKSTVAEVMNTALVENENALSFAKAVGDSFQEKEIASAALLPLEASLIPNVLGIFQGFMLEENEFTLIVLPSGVKEYTQSCEKYVVPYLENKYSLKNRRITLKYFGNREELEKVIHGALEIADNGFKWNIKEENGDYTLSLLFEHYDKAFGGEAVRYIVSNLQDGLYAEEDESLSERLFDILKLKKLKLSVAESFTGGRIVSSIISQSGASEVIYEGVVAYANGSKMKRLGVKEQALKEHGAVSSMVAYQMAAGLLADGVADVSIATTGIAGPNSDNTEKPVGLCYIAVGMKDGVHTYKLNLNGSREKITETAKNTALFLAIKKLKRI